MQESFAKYIFASPTTKKESAQLTSSNSIVGNIFIITKQKNKQKIIIKNKFNFTVAHLNENDSKEIILWLNKGLTVKALLAYVTFCEPKNQHNACFLFLAYPQSEANAFDNFLTTISNNLAEGNRPEIELNKFEVEKIVNSEGSYKPKKFLKKPRFDSGTVIVKGKMSFIEKIIEAGRQRRPGCYIASILFILVVICIVLLIVFI